MLDILQRQSEINNWRIDIDGIHGNIEIWEMRIWSRHADLVEADPVRKARFQNILVDNTVFGNYGFEEPVLMQDPTAMAVTYGGFHITGINMWIEKSHTNEQGDKYDRMKITYSFPSAGKCSFQATLPIVIEPDIQEHYEQYNEGTSWKSIFEEASPPSYVYLEERPDKV